MTTVNEKEPFLGQKVKLKNNESIIDAWCTYNPFIEIDEDSQCYKRLGWLFINPITNNLAWGCLLSDDMYEEIE